MPMRYNPYSGTLDITSAVGGQVDSISGTANRITISGSAVDPIVDIAATYVGQTTLTTLGTVATGTWNGDVVSEVYGGTNQSSYTTGDVLYASASNTLSKLPVGSNGEVLKLAAGIPSWAADDGVLSVTTDSGSAAPSAGVLNVLGTSSDGIQTAGASNTVTLTILDSSTTQRGTTLLSTDGIAIIGTNTDRAVTPVSMTAKLGAQTNGGICYGTGSTTAIAWSAALTDGQLLIGDTAGVVPVAANLSAGAGVSIVNAAGSITISASGGGFTWNEVTGTTDDFVASNGYICNNAGAVTITLPSSASLGDSFKITALQSSWSIAQNASQIIHFGDQSTTTGVGGSITSTNARDVLEFICVVANTDFQVLSSIGNLTIV